MLQILQITKLNLLKKISSAEFWITILLVLSVVYWFAKPFLDFSEHYNLEVNFGFTAFIFTNRFNSISLFACLIFLFSDIPFMDSQQNFLLIRSNKTKWIMSHVLYVFFVSLIYFSLIITASFAIVISHINFDPNNWGKVLITMSETDLGISFGLTCDVNSVIMHRLTPLVSFLYVFSVCVLIGTFLGLIMLLLNYIFEMSIGTVVAVAFTFLHLFAEFANGFFAYKLSPISWSSLKSIEIYNVHMPSIKYVYSFILIAIFVIISILIFTVVEITVTVVDVAGIDRFP